MEGKGYVSARAIMNGSAAKSRKSVTSEHTELEQLRLLTFSYSAIDIIHS
jgi:hypothetical protein